MWKCEFDQIDDQTNPYFLENILAETNITKLCGKSLVCVRIQLYYKVNILEH